MRLLDLFAGIGGFSHGLVQAGMELVGFCEIDKHAHQAYKILHDPEGRLWSAYDVRTIDPIQLPDFDCICFGWPCQDNSIAGKRSGQIKRDEFNEGNRSGLLYEATRIIRAKRPKYFIAENVEGLLTVNNGRDFYSTIREFTDMGYDVQWQILNSSAYVPQNRRRIFFVGHLRGERRPKVFPFGAENSNAIEVIGRLEGNHDQNSRVYGVGVLAPTLSTMQGGGQEPKIMIVGSTKPEGSNRLGTRDVVYDSDGLMGCLQASDYKQPKQVLVRPVLTPDREEKKQNGRRFKEPGEPMFTLTAQDKHGVSDGYRIRKLTPLECFRLQSFPDEWYYKLKEHGISDSQLYKMAGNAVTSVVAYEIGRRLMQ